MVRRKHDSTGAAQGGFIPIRFGANMKMFSSGASSFRADRDLFLEGVRLVDLDGVETLPLPADRSSLSSAGTPKAAFCRRVRALIVDGGGVGRGCVDWVEMTRHGGNQRSKAQHGGSLREIRTIRREASDR